MLSEEELQRLNFYKAHKDLLEQSELELLRSVGVEI